MNDIRLPTYPLTLQKKAVGGMILASNLPTPYYCRDIACVPPAGQRYVLFQVWGGGADA